MKESFALIAVAVLGAAFHSMPASAADDGAALRAEVDALKTEYESRIGALEARIARGLSPQAVRWVVVCVGVAMALSLLVS